MKTTKPKLSILMANYNNENYIAEAIESVLKQTFLDWELVVIDDGSTDNSVGIIKKYLNDKRIQFFQNKENIGKIATLKKLVKYSTADIVGILDSDDTLRENALQEIIKAYIEHPECGFIYSQFEFCDKDLNSIKRGLCKKMPPGRSNLHEIYTVALRTFKKKEYYKTSGYDNEILYAEDKDIILKLEEVTKFYFVDKVLYKYRRTGNTQTTDKNKILISRASCAWAEYKAYKRRINKKLPNITADEVAYRLLSTVPYCFLVGNFKRAKTFFITAITVCPLNIKLYLRLIIKSAIYPFKCFYYKIVGAQDPLIKKYKYEKS